MKQIIITILYLSTSILVAQTKNITGNVYDATDHEPLSGVVVQAENSKTHAITDINGKFRIVVPTGTLLVFSYPNYNIVKLLAKDGMTITLSKKAVSLGEVVIKADPLEDITHSVVIVDGVKKGSQPRNVADLFKDIPGFSLQKRSATAIEPSLRAFKYEEMNIKYDGGDKMVNACPNRMDPITAHVIPESVRKIEVVKGPFTVRFGQIFGGMVNMITHQSLPDRHGLHGNFQTGYETNGQNFVARGDITYATKKWDVGIDAEHRDFGDYKDGKGDLVPAGFKTDSYSVKLGMNPADNQRLLLNWHQKFGKDIKHAGLPMDSPKDNSYIAGLDYKINKIAPKVKYLQFKTYVSYVDHLMTNGYLLENPRPNYPAMDARAPVTSDTKGGKIEVALSPKKDWLIYTGIDEDYVHRDGTKTVIMNRNPNTGMIMNPPMIKKMKIWQNAFINDLGLFAEAHKKLNNFYYLNFGLRTDYVTAKAQNPAAGFTAIYGNIKQKDQLVLGGNIALKYKKPVYQLQIAFGRGTRTPSMTERYIYRFQVGNDGHQYIGNPDLLPEINNQIELSIQKKWHSFKAGGDIFYSYFQNYITPVIAPDLAITQNGHTIVPKVFKNVEAYQYGFDTYGQYQINDFWLIKADINFTKAYNLTLKEPLAQIAPPNGHLEVKYETNKYWLDLRGEFVATQTDYAPSFLETATPGHQSYDFRAGWRPTKDLSLGGAITNLTNETYYNHLNFSFVNAGSLNGQRIYEPGRSFSLYLKYKF